MPIKLINIENGNIMPKDSSFSSPFSLFLFSSLFALTWQPPLSHQNKISLSKEEIKGLTLKFEGLMILWFIKCLIAYFSMFIIGIKVPK